MKKANKLLSKVVCIQTSKAKCKQIEVANSGTN